MCNTSVNSKYIYSINRVTPVILSDVLQHFNTAPSCSSCSHVFGLVHSHINAELAADVDNPLKGFGAHTGRDGY